MYIQKDITKQREMVIIKQSSGRKVIMWKSMERSSITILSDWSNL